MAHFLLHKQRMNRWLVDPGNPREADEYTGTYVDGTKRAEIRAVIAVADGERIDFEVRTCGTAYIDPAAAERDFIAYLNSANSDAVRSLRLPDDAQRRPLEVIAGDEVIAGELVESPARRFLSGVTSRVRGLLPGYRK